MSKEGTGQRRRRVSRVPGIGEHPGFGMRAEPGPNESREDGRACNMPGSIELRKKRVLVVGLARTGVATALFCAGHNAIVTATDIRPESELGDAPMKLREAGVALELGGHHESTYQAQDLIVPSPGVPADDPFLKLA